MGMGDRARAGIFAAALAGALAVTLALAGCTSLTRPFTHATAPVGVATAPSTPGAGSTPGPTTAPTAIAESPTQKKVDAVTAAEKATAADVPEAGLVVLQTDIATPNGDTRMHLTVKATGSDTYRLFVTDFHTTTTAGHDLWLRQYPESPGECIEDGVSFGHTTWGGSFGAGSTPDAEIDLSTAGDDPSFLQNAVISSDTQTGCWSVQAVVPLSWHTPDRHPGLKVVDSGSASGARGTVTTTADGQPQVYTIAAGDTPVGLEARFGISDRDLAYLIVRDHPLGTGELKSGLPINLDPASR